MSATPRTSTDERRCFVCRGPFHPATGGLHWVEYTQRHVAFCGPCEIDLKTWLISHIKGRVRKIKVDGKTKVLRFYDHAHPIGEKDGES